MRKCRRKSNVEVIIEDAKGSSIEQEEIKISKCRRKSHVDIINEEMKVISSEQEEIGICKCRRRSLVDIMNKEVKVWTLSSKKQEAPPERLNTKQEICLKHMKRKVKIAAL